MNDQFIGDYKILKKIGAGGMAQVFLAVHRNVPDFKVILKMLNDQRMAERFKQEANKLALLEGHRNICQIKHFFSHGEDIVIAMEYIDGITLEEKIKNEQKLTLVEALEIISAVLDTLDFAHRKGIFHRDIKPSNIMIDKKGQVKIIDFGIAKAETDPSLTLAGSACGTPAYMAPEQFTPTEKTNYALVDIYATGLTLFTMLTGECPFLGDNEFVIRDAKLMGDVPKPRSLNPDIPKEVENIILKAINKDPKKRFQSASEMQAALDAARSEIKGNGLVGEVERTVAVPTRPTIKHKKSPVFHIVAAAVAVVALIAVGGYFFYPRGEKTGEMAVNVFPAGDVYVDDSLVGQAVASVLLTLSAGWHTLRVENDESLEKVFSDSVYVSEDTVRSLSFSFTFPTPTGTIAIHVQPSGDIYVDDSLIEKGASFAEVVRDTGWHIIQVENKTSKQKVFKDSVQLTQDGTVTRRFRFTFPTPKPVVEERPAKTIFGDVRVGTKPLGAEVFIDGKLQKERAPFTFKVKAGEHVVKVAIGDKVKDTTIMVKANNLHKVFLDLTTE
jgi:serine/threonine protein kinase